MESIPEKIGKLKEVQQRPERSILASEHKGWTEEPAGSQPRPLEMATDRQKSISSMEIEDESSRPEKSQRMKAQQESRWNWQQERQSSREQGNSQQYHRKVDQRLETTPED